MRKFLFAIVLLVPVLCWAAPDASGYNVAIHVQSSCLVTGIRSVEWDHLKVVIEGKKYELEAQKPFELLHVGDYKAKVVRDETKTPYNLDRIYEFQFPDGKTAKYVVVGESE